MSLVKTFFLIASMSYTVLAHAVDIDPQQESELALLYAGINLAESDESRMAASALFKEALKGLLYKKGAFDHPFDSLRMCKLISPDKQFRIFNWNVPLDAGQQFYEAIIMIPDEKTGMVKLIELTDQSAKMDESEVEAKVLKPEDWFGALYYAIVPFKKGTGNQYLLLGWDGDSRITNKKVIEVMSLNKTTLRFGSPIFKTDKGVKRRLVFTYAEQLSMSMVYQEKDKRIVFDHLAPRDQSLEGQYQFYGPDMSFDALEYKKGKWFWRSDVEYTRKRTGKDKDFNDPRRN